jgi:hypothetical protein
LHKICTFWRLSIVKVATLETRITYKMNIPAPGWRNWQTQRT